MYGRMKCGRRSVSGMLGKSSGMWGKGKAEGGCSTREGWLVWCGGGGGVEVGVQECPGWAGDGRSTSRRSWPV